MQRKQLLLTQSTDVQDGGQLTHTPWVSAKVQQNLPKP